MSVYTIYICSKHRSIDVNMYIYVYILFLLYLDCKYSQRLYLHTAVYRGRFSQFSGSMYRMNVDTKGGKIQYMAPMRHFKPSTYNRWLSWIFLGHPTLARFQKNSVAFGDQIPGRSGHAGIFDGQCWALQGSRILAWNCYSALHMCAGQNIFMGSAHMR